MELPGFIQRPVNGIIDHFSNIPTEKVQAVIDKYSGGRSPLTAALILTASKITKVPVDMFLVMAASESNMGIAGRAVSTMNAMNVGNVDNGANEYQNGWMGGLLRFGWLIAREYFPGRQASLDQFIANDFRRPDGARYMTDQGAKDKIIRLTREIRQMLGLPPGSAVVAEGNFNTNEANANQEDTFARDPYNLNNVPESIVTLNNLMNKFNT